MNAKYFVLREKFRSNPAVANAIVLGQTLVHSNRGPFRAQVLKANQSAAQGKGVALCCRIRDEARYIREWMEYYLAAGVEHVFYYEKLSTDDYRAALQPYIDRGVVTLLDNWPHYPVSPAAEQDCILRTIGRHQWVGFIDADEFVVIRDGRSIPEYLSGFSRSVGIALNWYMYGSNSHKTRPPGPVIAEYVRRAAEPNRHVKVFLRPEVVANYRNSHSWYFRWMRAAVNESGHPVRGSVSLPPSAKDAWINHYNHKSDQDFFEKAARKSVLDTVGIKFDTRNAKGHADSEANDNVVVDDCALQYYLTRCRALSIPPVLLEQHSQLA